MELIIFAKKGTTDKVMIPCLREMSRVIMLSLKEKHGGDWLMVDRLSGSGEYLLFKDELVYQGFHPDIKRYSTAIKSL